MINLFLDPTKFIEGEKQAGKKVDQVIKKMEKMACLCYLAKIIKSIKKDSI